MTHSRKPSGFLSWRRFYVHISAGGYPAIAGQRGPSRRFSNGSIALLIVILSDILWCYRRPTLWTATTHVPCQVVLADLAKTRLRTATVTPP